MTLWKESLDEKADAETKARINGCKKQMKSFSFYFGLNLGRKLYAHTDNLSKTLQKEKMSAISGKELADLTIKTMHGMRNDRDLICSTRQSPSEQVRSISFALQQRQENAKGQSTTSCSFWKAIHAALEKPTTQKLLMPTLRPFILRQLT